MACSASGYLAFVAGDFEQAARRFQDAANPGGLGSPTDAADYWFQLGATRERLGQWVEAQRAYEGCLQISAPATPVRISLLLFSKAYIDSITTPSSLI